MKPGRGASGGARLVKIVLLVSSAISHPFYVFAANMQCHPVVMTSRQVDIVTLGCGRYF